MATIQTVTLGCKVNQYETELVREGLARAGYRDALPGERASLCIVNTCTVTAEGDAKSRQVIRRLARENPEARIVVMGCYATRAPGEISVLPGVAEVITDKREIPDLLGRHGVVDPPDGISGFSGRNRAFVKIQDGCMLKCSYCIIPHVRPHLVSRPDHQVLDEVRRLVDNGYREIVLTGIHLGHYGIEWNWGRSKADWFRLSHLLERIADLPGSFRVRLSSMEATEVTRELIRVMRDRSDRICPHLHVCLQSGSDRILRRMRRRWGARRFLDVCRAIRDALDRPCLTTDILVGFPGETDDDFERTVDVAREAGFAKMHVFPFSPRKGTAAAAMDDPVPPAKRKERVDRLAGLERDLREAYLRALVGSRLQVLVETPTRGRGAIAARGTACRYVPVELLGEPLEVGSLVSVQSTASIDGRLVARTTA
ncbi:MAG: tRNA (N(6)-L-threonylcarbamoyladenosine(37)-C(2))-methylthiotransferase MtaB [Planctomycetes bacterium]|nr:tRNA (N(6)-L-threonylcarbamoyladenosine(37)-C(2))-methylthiotransferase MtaB [Planctomycetota bacterium]